MFGKKKARRCYRFPMFGNLRMNFSNPWNLPEANPTLRLARRGSSQRVNCAATRGDIMKRVGSLSSWVLVCGLTLSALPAKAQTVYVSRFWHNHQPTYWPEWNGNGDQNSRMQYTQDSIVLKGGQDFYGDGKQHPENDLSDIFGKGDRVASYQSGPRNSLASLADHAGFAMSYSGSLIEGVNSLGQANNLGYGSGWWNGYREATEWVTPKGSRRMDMVGFTYHHSLAPLLPKAVLRKEIQTFKQAWWKAWNKNSDLSDHSKGFFPTEMAFSTELIDVLVDEGYEWAIVASHHLSRTCPTYNTKADPEGSFNIASSPPNRADQMGPSPTEGWWYSEPNPGNAAWNVSPFAYQLHKVKYVNPSTGAEKTMIAVPSDDVLSYKAGYSGAEVGMISGNIAPYANDSAHPVMVLPSTDGDNAWGGGSSSWNESTPSFFSSCQNSGYQTTTIQDFVNDFGGAATLAHVEDGAWIFPEMCYGSPYFLKWLEHPLNPDHLSSCYPGTMVDLETPGFALKFWSYAPLMAGANWCETAEQIMKDEGGTVEAWKIQAPYNWNGDGSWNSPNVVELAWHIYLGGLDSGFNYYGGLGNDDEMKPALATKNAIEKLQSYMSTRLGSDQTPPTALRPQRFPYNPGAYTFGWFNNTSAEPGFLKKMESDFYVWTHIYDVSGVQSATLKIRLDKDGYNTMGNNDNETYAGGNDVDAWISVPMTMRTLPNTREALNAAADHGEIDYGNVQPPFIADYYFAKIDNSVAANFRDKLIDYYVEATDGQGNVSKSDIQHVFVEDDGAAPPVPPGQPTNVGATAISSSKIFLSWTAGSNAVSYVVKRDGSEIDTTSAVNYTDSGLTPLTSYSYTLIARNASGDSSESASANATTWDPPVIPNMPSGLVSIAVSHAQINLEWDAVDGATAYVVKRDSLPVATPSANAFSDTGLTPQTSYSYTIAATNEAGTSADSATAEATTGTAPQEFSMEGAADFAGYLISKPGMTVYAAVRGTILYVATWSPGDSVGTNDHFILVSDSLLSSAISAAPWAKSGTVAVATDKPYLAGESAGSYASWFNAPGDSGVASSVASAGQLEGFIDLAAVFGSVPSNIYLAAIAYQTGEAGALAGQAPAGNGDGNVDPSEFMAFPVEAIRDSLANGTFDRLDPARSFRISGWGTGGNPDLKWLSVPGRAYQPEYSTNLGDAWLPLGDPLQATSGQDELSIPDVMPGTNPHRFFRIRLEDQ